jgi:hypothetical protein
MWTLLVLLAFSAVPDTTYQGFDFVSQKTQDYKLTQKDYTIIYFFNAECPCSDAHFQYLNELKTTYNQWSFLGFHSNKGVSQQKAQEYFDQFKISFPIIQDVDLKMADQLKAIKTPHVYIVDAKGEIIYQGGATNSKDPTNASKHYLKEVLSALKTNQPLPYSSTKTLGCYIER